jgi:hypothetical protein
MTRKLIAAVLVVLGTVAPLRADLKYTTRTEFTPAPPAPADAPPPNAVLAMIGSQVTRQLLPGGPIETTIYVSDKATRTEYVKGGTGQYHEGTTTLLMADGTFVVMSPTDRTYWKAPPQSAGATAQLAGIQPQVASVATGESKAIAGVNAKRTTFDISIDLPIPEPIKSQLPPGFPSSITMSGDVWLATSPFEKYLPILSKNAEAMGAQLGLGKVLAGGIPMEAVIRSAAFGDQQLEVHVTSIADETVASSLFDIPADYKEVPGPIR